MTISGSGNISSSNADWNPSITPNMDKKSVPPDKEVGAQGELISGLGADYAVESNLGASKFRKTQNRHSSSARDRLKGTPSRSSASVRGFLQGFGTRASRISARRAEAAGEGASMLPSDLEMVNVKKNRISPEMQGFFLEASGFANQSFSTRGLKEESLGLTHLNGIEGVTNLVALTGPVRKAVNTDDSIVNAWTVSRLGGEMVSRLLDPNAESSSLLRRAALLTHEGTIDLADLETLAELSYFKDVEEMTTPKGDYTKDLFSMQWADDIEGQKLEKETMSEAEASEMIAQMMASVMTSGSPVVVFTPLGQNDVITKFPAPRISGTLAFVYTDDQLKIGAQSDKGSEMVSQSMNFSETLRVDFSTELGKEAINRFPLDIPAEQNNSASFGFLSHIAEAVPSSSEQGWSFSGDLSDQTQSSIVSSAYLFSSNQGMALMALSPRSMDDYEKALEFHKGPGGPPDPLIYQYRNIAVDPAIVLNPPKVFASSSKLQVQGKPETASVHDDGGGASSGDRHDEEQKENKPSDKDGAGEMTSEV